MGRRGRHARRVDLTHAERSVDAPRAGLVDAGRRVAAHARERPVRGGAPPNPGDRRVVSGAAEPRGVGSDAVGRVRDGLWRHLDELRGALRPLGEGGIRGGRSHVSALARGRPWRYLRRGPREPARRRRLRHARGPRARAHPRVGVVRARRRRPRRARREVARAITVLEAGYNPAERVPNIRAVMALTGVALEGAQFEAIGTPLLLEHGDEDALVPTLPVRTCTSALGRRSSS